MSRQTEMQELTRIITCSQKLEQLKALLAKGEKRTQERRINEWEFVRQLSAQQLAAYSMPQSPIQPELSPNEATPPSQ